MSETASLEQIYGEVQEAEELLPMNELGLEFGYALYEATITAEEENPVEFSANISAAKGETSTRQFGESESYDKVIVMGTDAPPIDEYTVLWVDKTPQVDETGALVTNDDGEVITPHDYIVKKVAKSLNSVSVAISKVTVSG